MWQSLTAVIFGIMAAIGSIFSPSMASDLAVHDNENTKTAIYGSQQVNETTTAKTPEVAAQTEERKTETPKDEGNAELIDVTRHEKQNAGNMQDGASGGNVAVLVDK